MSSLTESSTTRGPSETVWRTAYSSKAFTTSAHSAAGKSCTCGRRSRRTWQGQSQSIHWWLVSSRYERWVQFAPDRESFSSTFAIEAYVVVNKRSCQTLRQIVNAPRASWNASKQRYWSEHLTTPLTSLTQIAQIGSVALTPENWRRCHQFLCLKTLPRRGSHRMNRAGNTRTKSR